MMENSSIFTKQKAVNRSSLSSSNIANITRNKLNQVYDRTADLTNYAAKGNNNDNLFI